MPKPITAADVPDEACIAAYSSSWIGMDEEQKDRLRCKLAKRYNAVAERLPGQPPVVVPLSEEDKSDFIKCLAGALYWSARLENPEREGFREEHRRYAEKLRHAVNRLKYRLIDGPARSRSDCEYVAVRRSTALVAQGSCRVCETLETLGPTARQESADADAELAAALSREPATPAEEARES